MNLLYFVLIYTGYILISNFGFSSAGWLFGVRVEKFFVWYDTKFSLFKFKINHTTFGLGWLPTGGYVKLSGFVKEEHDELKTYHFLSKPIPFRLIITLSGPLLCLSASMFFYFFMDSIIIDNIANHSLELGKRLMILGVVYLGIYQSVKGIKIEYKNTWIVYALLLIWYLFLISVLVVYIGNITPFFESVKFLFGNDNIVNVSGGIIMEIVPFIGICSFFSGIIPGSGVGLPIVRVIYSAVMGKEIEGRITERIELTLALLVWVIYIWFFYKFVCVLL